MFCNDACLFFAFIATLVMFSRYVKYVAAAVEMPDAMEIIFQKALAVGTCGAVSNFLLCRKILIFLFLCINTLMLVSSCLLLGR